MNVTIDRYIIDPQDEGNICDGHDLGQHGASRTAINIKSIISNVRTDML